MARLHLVLARHAYRECARAPAPRGGAPTQIHSEEEVRRILPLARKHGVPVTFRAAGTSLSGQALTDSVLLKLSHTGKNFRCERACAHKAHVRAGLAPTPPVPPARAGATRCTAMAAASQWSRGSSAAR